MKKRDFILIDHVAKVKETGEIFDTTVEDVARKEGVFKENVTYGPMLVVVGEGWLLKSLDDSLQGLKVRKPVTIEIPPDKAFGPRDSSKIRLMPLRRFRREKVAPYPGMQVEVDGKLAVIRTVGAGRVQVDFNPPLAGKTLVYDLTVKKILRKQGEKIRALIHRRIPSVDVKKFNLKVLKKTVRIELPEETFYVDGLQFAKRGIANDVQKFFPRVGAVSFVETFRKKPPAKPTGEAPRKRASS